MSIETQIINIATTAAREISKAVDSGVAIADKVNSELVEVSGKLLAAKDSYNDLVAAHSDERSSIASERTALDNQRREIKASLNDAVGRITDLNGKCHTSETYLAKLVSDVEKAKEEVELMDTILGGKQSVLNEMNELQAQLNDLRAKITTEETDAKIELERLTIAVTEARNAYNDIVKDNMDAKAEVAPDLEYIATEKARLVKKEEDLNIIIERYKKLYADNNANFRITE